MALYVLICHDRPDSLALRMATREAHLAYVRDHPLPLKVAGPILSDSGDMAGSILVFEADSRDQVQAFADQDPYAISGLFERSEIMGWKVTLGALG
ncbi:MAG: hypothetical protein RJA87_633 [Pseudomonadota bacterium]|jgi:uncharacterized protein YciI